VQKGPIFPEISDEEYLKDEKSENILIPFTTRKL
jgi:hypothetical protein